VFALVDSVTVGLLECSLPRDDLIGTPYRADSGFHLELPKFIFDGRPHTLELRSPFGRDVPIPFIHEGRQKTRLTIQDIVRPIIHSMVDDVVGGAILGWVLRQTNDSKHGDQSVLVTSDDEPVMEVRADRFRPDVAAEHQADAYCGFRFVPPLKVRRARGQTFRFFLLPEKVELDGSPLAVNLMTDAQQSKIIQLSETVFRLEHELQTARDLLESLLPTPEYTLSNYQDWADLYFRHLHQRQVALTDTPLVSIICPVYGPNLAHFRAMLESVYGQTYRHWELILVDDGSDDPALDEAIAEAVTADKRVIVMGDGKHHGISVATATGLSKATGDWVACVDHDDLLDPQALLVMLAAAEKSGACLLYSDEDKIDDRGEFVQPHLKPDFNYRLLLANNYMCHLLMARRDVVRETVFDSTYDGAQDHNLVLSLAERLSPEQIHHVPEILYHWRITADSTARDPAVKPYAAAAGVAAVRAHLKRRKKTAGVTAIHDATFYRVDWRSKQTPRVAAVILCKDQAALTQQCLNALKQTEYPNWELTLVDNWSTEPGALAMLEAFDRDAEGRVLRVEEPFNFSRLNNLAAADSAAEFFLFQNNDVIHQQPDWLRHLLGEMLADPTVAVVGPKLVYPNGFVQHGGVILGLGGVADHAHRGLPAQAPGYFGRAIVAQEVCAVTAACMLVRTSAFRAVGGFDESFAVAFNDVDLCLRLRQAGHKIIYAPEVIAVHHESASRGRDDQGLKQERLAREIRLMWDRWSDQLRADPFYNPHFSVQAEAFFQLKPPPVESPIALPSQTWSNSEPV